MGTRPCKGGRPGSVAATPGRAGRTRFAPGTSSDSPDRLYGNRMRVGKIVTAASRVNRQTGRTGTAPESTETSPRSRSSHLLDRLPPRFHDQGWVRQLRFSWDTAGGGLRRERVINTNREVVADGRSTGILEIVAPKLLQHSVDDRRTDRMQLLMSSACFKTATLRREEGLSSARSSPVKLASPVLREQNRKKVPEQPVFLGCRNAKPVRNHT